MISKCYISILSVISLSSFIPLLAYGQLKPGIFQGDDNYQDTCQLKISETGTHEQYHGEINYVLSTTFTFSPLEETVFGRKRIRKGEYGAKILKDPAPENANPVKYSLLVDVDESGNPLKFFFFDNTDDGPKFKRRQYTCTFRTNADGSHH